MANPDSDTCSPAHPLPASSPRGSDWPVAPGRAATYLACAMLGYIGIYLCRKNLSVAIPMIQQDLGVTKAQLGVVASYSTIAYAVGKIFFGPIIDRVGGRICFLFALLAVAVLGGLGSLSSSIPMLTLCYSANRFAGAAGWGSMVKQVPDWFPGRRLALAMAFLSLSFVFGGVAALLVAGRISSLTGNNWRAVMGLPAILLVLILLVNWLVLPRPAVLSPAAAASARKPESRLTQFLSLAAIPQFWVVCGLSFLITITRETFNTWTVDFMKTEGGPHMSTEVAAFLSTPFDAAGAVGILLMGWILDRLSARRRTIVLFGNLAALAVLIYFLPALLHQGLTQAAVAIGVIGFLSYGPYSLLAGILALEIRGKEFVATVAGFVDASGYLAGIVSGYYFGRIVDHGGYLMGFHFLAAVTFLAAVLSLALRRANPSHSTPATS